MTEIYNNKYLI